MDMDTNKGFINQPAIFWPLEKLIGFAENRLGAGMLPARLLLWTPKAFISSMILEGLIAHRKGKVDERLMKLIRMQVSLLIACPFCIDMNSSDFRKYNITSEEIKAMQRSLKIKNIESFDYKEKLTLYFIRGLVRTPIKHHQPLIDEMVRVFDEKEFATIITTIAQVDYWTRVIQGFGIQPAGFLDRCDRDILFEPNE